MRSLLALFGIYVLAVLLAGSSPLGAGDATHGGALLHPVVPHVHGRAGESVPSAQQDTRVRHPQSGTALDSNPGGATELPTLGLTPALPRAGVFLADRPAERRFRGFDQQWHHRFLDPPPDPPPTTRAWSFLLTSGFG